MTDTRHFIRSFGFSFGPEGKEVFIQGSIYHNNSTHDAAGLYGDKQYETIGELVGLTQLGPDEAKKLVDKITELCNS